MVALRSIGVGVYILYVRVCVRGTRYLVHRPVHVQPIWVHHKAGLPGGVTRTSPYHAGFIDVETQWLTLGGTMKIATLQGQADPARSQLFQKLLPDVANTYVEPLLIYGLCLKEESC